MLTFFCDKSICTYVINPIEFLSGLCQEPKNFNLNRDDPGFDVSKMISMFSEISVSRSRTNKEGKISILKVFSSFLEIDLSEKMAVEVAGRSKSSSSSSSRIRRPSAISPIKY